MGERGLWGTFLLSWLSRMCVYSLLSLVSHCWACGPNAQQQMSGLCECLPGYCALPDVGNCVKCDVSCLLCFGCGADQCLACESPETRLVNGRCLATEGPKLQGNRAAKQVAEARDLTDNDDLHKKCSSSNCPACAGDFCPSCALHAHIVDHGCLCDSFYYEMTTALNCVFGCGPGYYVDSSLTVVYSGTNTGICTPCNGSCAHCTGPGSTQCIDCYTGYFLDSGTSTCILCVGLCATCHDGDSSHCDTCLANSSMTGSPPSTCNCDSGYFVSGRSCLPCNSSCLECSNGAGTGCSQCKAHAELSSGSAPSSCVCSIGWYGSPSSCLPCVTTCKTCSGGLATQCLTCKLHASLSLSNPNACECDPHYYPATAADNCLICYSDCYKCSTYAVCTSCYSNASVSAPNCVCDPGYFPNPGASACTLCPGLCATCHDGDLSHCDTCLAHSSMTASPPSTCNCDSGYFASGRSCLPCDSSCLECSDGTVSGCTQCKAHAELSSGSAPSSCVCSIGWYGSPSSCLPCVPTCKACSGGLDTQCLSCKAYASLSLSNACECDFATIPLPDASNCVPCHSTCFNCIQPDINSCIACHAFAYVFEPPPGPCLCDDGYFTSSDSSYCQVCHPSCGTCMGPTSLECLSCLDFAQLSGPSPNTCICVQSAFPNPDIQHCEMCTPTCLTCKEKGASRCLSCFPGATLASPAPSTCLCADGYFPNPDSSNCVQCAEMCLTCMSPNLCLSCKANAALQGDGTCLCTEGYYGEAWSCKQCSVGCQVCNIVGCIKCWELWFLYGYECVPYCPVGYEVKDSICELGDLTPPEPSMIVNADNSLTVTFSKSIYMNLSASDLDVEVTDVDSIVYSTVWSEPVVLNSTCFSLLLTLSNPSLPPHNQCLLTFLHPHTVVSLLGAAMIKDQLVGVLHTSAVDKRTGNATGLSATAKTVAQGSVGVAVTASVMSGNAGSLWSLLNQIQMITYIPMTKMPVPDGLMTTLAALDMGNWVPNPFGSALPANDTSQTPPDYATRYEVSSALFLLNTGLNMGSGIALIFSLVPIYIASKVTTGPLSQHFKRMVPSFRWGVPLRWWIQSYLDLAIYSLLQIQQVVANSGFSGAAEGANFLLSTLFASIVLITPIGVYVLLGQNYCKMNSRQDAIFNKR